MIRVYLKTLAKSIVVFLFLLLALWWSLTSVVAYMSTRWMPKSFFRFEQEKDAHIEFPLLYANVFESALFSVVALPGYMGVTNGGGGIFSNMGGYKKYRWLSLAPWLITFAQGWLINVGDFVWNVASAMEATNFGMFTFLWISGLIVQALLWSEVFCVALQGGLLMKNAHSQECHDLPLRRKLFTPNYKTNKDEHGDQREN